MKLTKLKVLAGAKPFTDVFEAAGDALEYSGRDLVVRMGKRELLISPTKYRQSWMSEVMKPGVNPEDIPFAEYVWNQVMLELAAEINDSTAYNGVYNAAGATAADIATGFAKLIADEITATNLVPVVTGAITNTNAVSKFEQMWKSLPVTYRKAGANLYCSFNSYDKYQEDYREKYGKYMEVPDGGYGYIDGSSRKGVLKPVTWMNTSSRLITTPKENLLLGCDLLSDLNKINTVPALWTMQVGIAFGIGFQIRDLEAIKVNDQV